MCFADTVSPQKRQKGTSAMATYGAAQQENNMTGVVTFNQRFTVFESSQPRQWICNCLCLWLWLWLLLLLLLWSSSSSSSLFSLPAYQVGEVAPGALRPVVSAVQCDAYHALHCVPRFWKRRCMDKVATVPNVRWKLRMNP